MPSNWLDVECSKDQRKAPNPTPCDVQVGAIIGQIFGDNAKTGIAKRRIDIMMGNVNSYAQISNGHHSWTALRRTMTLWLPFLSTIMK
jgi:hypothetical protein